MYRLIVGEKMNTCCETNKKDKSLWQRIDKVLLVILLILIAVLVFDYANFMSVLTGSLISTTCPTATL